ncbi:MAG: transcriptional regulator [Candidatus Margulisiibacteriota bacterium]|nr:MAG: hypothetical protein A2X43_10085 [Candidatus Margulisbacteria bacterium GWD2_39_127]OGI01436.1 MAG: hypothetical protein A2X42_06730 [Candidatus Margulisbacteria bacterium GWF2_38_17]OGI10071.1 MAG: hypothetical protein A2X41_10350 [Candidatus Margulisbacteria bacterium GWE2_39_32]PZM78963.1 MAG: transcriptional regulator [Candidatus Margulisiibacteriota bacterium]HAR64402.1 transcriptional regulator [Candidatus Margulisiibacteriota bacterium]
MVISKKNIRIAEVIKALGHAVRFQILAELLKVENDCNVSTIQKILKVPQSALSQHLTLLKNKGFLNSRSYGVERYYFIKDAKIKTYIRNLLAS